MKTDNKKNIFKAFGAWLKEKIRRILVALKKNPQIIPMASLCITFVAYAFTLTYITKVALSFNGEHMGLATFATVLFMMLSFVCMLNAYPKRQKVKIPMIILMLVLYGVVIFADYHFISSITEAVTREVNRREFTEEARIAFSTANTNMILVGVTAALAVFEPLYAKLIKKINTSIEVEVGQNIDVIEISDED